MSASLNKAMIIGNLGKDAELKYMPDGTALANFSVATTEKWTGKDGTKKEQTEWHLCSLWGKVAERVAAYLVKGKQVYCEGQLQTRKWEKDGQTHYTTEIKVHQIRLLGGGAKSESPSDSDTGSQSTSVDDSDIPF